MIENVFPFPNTKAHRNRVGIFGKYIWKYSTNLIKERHQSDFIIHSLHFSLRSPRRGSGRASGGCAAGLRKGAPDSPSAPPAALPWHAASDAQGAADHGGDAGLVAAGRLMGGGIEHQLKVVGDATTKADPTARSRRSTSSPVTEKRPIGDDGPVGPVPGGSAARSNAIRRGSCTPTATAAQHQRARCVRSGVGKRRWWS